MSEMTMPPSAGRQPPENPVPAPRGTNGKPSRFASLTIALTCSADGGMNGREDVSRQRRGNEPSALLSDTKPWPEERLGRRRAEANESRGMDQGDLGVEPRPAGGDLGRVRLGVNPPLAARPPLEVLHRVGDGGLTPIDTGFLEGSIEQPAGRPD